MKEYSALRTAQGILARINFLTEKLSFTMAMHCSITQLPPKEATAEITGINRTVTEDIFSRLLISNIPVISGESVIPKPESHAVTQERIVLKAIMTVHITKRERDAESIVPVILLFSFSVTPPSFSGTALDIMIAIVRQASTFDIYMTIPAVILPSTPFPSIIRANVGEMQ